MKNDEYFMQLAIEEARKGEGKTGHRPFVGCVIVKNGKIIAKGCTQQNAVEHAEANALKKAKSLARKATLYSTLEPCNHNSQGKSCADQILEKGVTRVVWGCHDPTEKNLEGATKKLRRKKIRVTGNILKKDCEKLHEIFLTNITKKRPFVFLSTAMSLDGKITWKKRERPIKFSSKETLNKVHEMRSKTDAVCIGKNTLRIDNPRLTARIRKAKNPDRIVVDSKALVSPNARIFSSGKERVFVLATTKASQANCKRLQKKGAIIVKTASRGGKADLKSAFKELYKKYRITSVMVEGGGELIASFLKAKLVDKIFFWYSPIIIGGRETPTPVEGTCLKSIEKMVRIEETKTRFFGKDIRIEGYPEYP